MPSRLRVPAPAPFQCSPTVRPTASLWISTRWVANSSASRLRSGKSRHAGMFRGETSPAGQIMVPPTSSARTVATVEDRRPLLDLQQLLAHRVDDRFHPRVQVQLLEDVADVVLDGVLGDVELLGDVAVVVALGDELEDLHLAVGEPRGGELLLLVGSFDHGGELVEELGGHRRGDQRLALGDRADGVGDLLDGDLLEQVAVGAGLDGVVEVGLLVGDRQHEDLGVGDEVLDGLGRLDAAAPRHADVHQHHVGHQLLGLVDGLGAVAGLSDDLDVVLLLEHHLEATAEQRVVVHDQHADGLPCAPRSRLPVVGHALPSQLAGLLRAHHGFGSSATAPSSPRRYTTLAWSVSSWSAGAPPWGSPDPSRSSGAPPWGSPDPSGGGRGGMALTPSACWVRSTRRPLSFLTWRSRRSTTWSTAADGSVALAWARTSPDLVVRVTSTRCGSATRGLRSSENSTSIAKIRSSNRWSLVSLRSARARSFSGTAVFLPFTVTCMGSSQSGRRVWSIAPGRPPREPWNPARAVGSACRMTSARGSSSFMTRGSYWPDSTQGNRSQSHNAASVSWQNSGQNRTSGWLGRLDRPGRATSGPGEAMAGLVRRVAGARKTKS